MNRDKRERLKEKISSANSLEQRVEALEEAVNLR